MYAAPLALVPGGFVRFVFPKLLVVVAAVLLGALARAPGRLPRPVAVLVGVFVGVFVVAAVASATPVASLVGRWPRYEGVLVLLVYAACLWVGARLLPPDARACAPTVVVAASWAAIVLAATSVVELFGVPVAGATDVSRPGGLLGNATDQGLVAVLLLAVLLEPAFVGSASRGGKPVDRGSGALPQVGLVAAATTVAASGSRSALVAVAVVLAVHAVVLRPSRRTAVLVGVGAAVAVGSAWAWGRLAAADTVTGRLLLWRESGELAWDHPLLGIGPSRFVDAIGAVHGEEWAREVGPTNPPDSPHSVLLQATLAGGVLLLVALLALAVVVAVLAWRRTMEQPGAPLRAALVAGPAGWGVAMLANPTSAGPTCLALFLLGAAVGEVGVSTGRGAAGRRARWPARLVAAAAAALLVVLAAATASEVVLQRGVTAATRGEVATADRMLTAAHRLRPLDGDVCMLGAQALAARTSAGDLAAAGPALDWARCSLARTPETLQSGLAASVALTSLDRADEARLRLDDLAELYPTSPDVYLLRAVAQAQLGDRDAARADLLTARALAPDDPRVAMLWRRLRTPG